MAAITPIDSYKLHLPAAVYDFCMKQQLFEKLPIRCTKEIPPNPKARTMRTILDMELTNAREETESPSIHLIFYVASTTNATSPIDLSMKFRKKGFISGASLSYLRAWEEFPNDLGLSNLGIISTKALQIIRQGLGDGDYLKYHMNCFTPTPLSNPPEFEQWHAACLRSS